jgi:hypothetical protein
MSTYRRFNGMIGFIIEFRPWYLVFRGPRGRIYLAFGFAKRLPKLSKFHTTYQERVQFGIEYD